MGTFNEDTQALIEAGTQHDRLAAWHAAGGLVSHLSNNGTPVTHQMVFSLVWRGAARHRWFDIAELIAGAAAARADATPSSRRLHAQMLMERGFTEEALGRLDSVLAEPRLTAFDREQAFGHIGRIHKDRFVSAADAGDEQQARASLRLALGAYGRWREVAAGGSPWLGVNAVALLSRPEAAALDPKAAEDARRFAREIQALVTRRPDAYAAATLAETHLALNEPSLALESARHYVTDPAVHGFSLNNFHRQLATVWQTDRRPAPGPELLALVSAALMERSACSLQLSARDVRLARAVNYEAVFGADRFDSLDNYRRGLERCSCVARIGRSADTGVGSGFLLPGHLLSGTLGSRLVLVTNAHVMTNTDAERRLGALDFREAVVTFAALEGVSPTREFGVARIVFESGRGDLDVTIAELGEEVDPEPCYKLAPVLPLPDSQAQIRIIGHPSGRGLSLSVNELLDHETPKVHYLTATEGGSSGSPVFNQQWNLIGIHHAGGDAIPRLNGKPGTYQANEGIWIDAIREALRARA